MVVHEVVQMAPLPAQTAACATHQPKLQNTGESITRTLNHSNVTPSVDLDDFADSATPDVTVSEDVPMLYEVTRAIYD